MAVPSSRRALLATLMGVAVVTALACSGPPVPRHPLHVPPPPPPPKQAPFAPLDPAADPCRDFAAYACGGADEQLVRDADLLAWRAPALQRFLDELRAGRHLDGSPATALVRDFYSRCSDIAARESGFAELRTELAQIERIATLSELARAAGELYTHSETVLISINLRWDLAADDKRVYARLHLRGPFFRRGGSRKSNQHSVDEQRAHWQRLAANSGAITPDEVEAALRINDWLATSRAEDKDPEPAPIPVQRGDFARARFPWAAFFAGLRLPESIPLRAADADELARIDRLADLPLADQKSFVRVMMVEGASEYLGTAMLDEDLHYHNGWPANGHVDSRALTQSCIHLTALNLELPLADSYLSTLADARSEALVRPLFDALRARLARAISLSNWMDVPNRTRAINKVRAVQLRLIGDVEAAAPNASLAGSGSFFDAYRRVLSANETSRLARLGAAPPDPDSLPTFHPGAYSPTSNAFWLSPEIVRTPYVWGGDYNAFTFGAMGSIIGHELVHAFARVPLVDTAVKPPTESQPTIRALRGRSQCLERWFDSLAVASHHSPSSHSNAEEDVADLVGVELALQALETQAAAPTSHMEDGFRRDFFLAYAHTMCGFGADHRTLVDDLNDPHAPVRTRINGVVANLPAFAAAFACAPGAPMAPREHCGM